MGLFWYPQTAEYKEVYPFAPEPISKQDGTRKNYCERNAAKRLLEDTRREHPRMKLIVIEDALASNATHIRLLQSLKFKYILGAKPSDHKFLFNWVETSLNTTHYEYTDEQNVLHRFRYLNKAPLNHTHADLLVNFIEYWGLNHRGKHSIFLG